MQSEVLILDDDPMALRSMSSALSGNFRVVAFTEPEAAEARLRRMPADVALLDLHFPRHSGTDLLRAWKKRYPHMEFVFCSGDAKVSRAVECLQEGAADYLVKPFLRQDLIAMVRRALERRQKVQAQEFVVGTSAAMQELMGTVGKLRGETHLNVLILGESGTGKERIARLLHEQERHPRPFVVVNAPAIPSSLFEGELFGVEKGAYTDARVTRPGRLELADKGDVFIDEIGELQSDSQAKLLRVIQEKRVERLGASHSRQVEFRTITATNRPMSYLLKSGNFREDLLYRLSDVVLWVPPLRDRLEDIPAMAEAFVRKHSGKRKRRLGPKAIERLVNHPWPGNIRQLESTIKRALVLSSTEVVDDFQIDQMNRRDFVENLPQDFCSRMDHLEKKVLEEALNRNGGDRIKAMQELKLPRATFYRKLQHHKIDQ